MIEELLGDVHGIDLAFGADFLGKQPGEQAGAAADVGDVHAVLQPDGVEDGLAAGEDLAGLALGDDLVHIQREVGQACTGSVHGGPQALPPWRQVALADLVDPLEAEAGAGTGDGLALGVQDLGLEHDVNHDAGHRSSTGKNGYATGPPFEGRLVGTRLAGVASV